MNKNFIYLKSMFILALAFTTTISHAQIQSREAFVSKPVENKIVLEKYHKDLDNIISAFEVHTINDEAIYSLARNTLHTTLFTLQAGEHRWELDLKRVDLRSEDYRFLVVSDEGDTWQSKSEAVTYRGFANGNVENTVYATISGSFVTFTIQDGTGTYEVEPISWYSTGAAPDDYIIYNTVDFRNTQGCGFKLSGQVENELREGNKGTISSNGSAACTKFNAVLYGTEDLTTNKGGAAATESALNSWFNKVQGNYKLNLDVELVLTGVVASTSKANDPQTARTDYNAFLTGVQNWGKSGKLNQFSHDLAGIIIHTGSTGINGVGGVASASSVCNATYKYMWSSDLTPAYTMAHEFGHMFGVSHDSQSFGAPYDMTNSCGPNSGANTCKCMMCIVSPAPNGDPFLGMDRIWSQRSKDMVAAFAASTACKKACSLGTGIAGIAQEEEVMVYPNPSGGLFTLEYTGREKNIRVEVYNFMGEIVYASQFPFGLNGNERLDLSNQAQGAYFIQIIAGKNQRTKRVIIGN